MKDATTNLDVIALGEPMVEFNQQPDGMMQQGIGGDTSNAAISAARQGARVGYITRLGEDIFGEAILNIWKAENVDTSQVSRDERARVARRQSSTGPKRWRRIASVS